MTAVPEALLTFVILFSVVLITAGLFFVWLVIKVIGGFVRLVTGAGRSPGPARPPYAYHRALPPPPPARVNCGHARCRALNPGGARFCRRCGKMLGSSEEIAAYRQLAW